MPATKMPRRKAQPASRLSGKSTTPLKQHNASMNIGSFARVSKAISVTAKDLDAKPSTTPASVTPATIEIKLASAATSTTLSSRKRKTAVTSDDESSTQQRASKRVSSAAVVPLATTASKRTVRSRIASAPQKSCPAPTSQPQSQRSKRARSPSASDSEEPTINAGALFKKLRLEASPGPATPPLTPDASGISDCEDSGSTPDILPDEVLGLLDLHAALLKTLTLHYAHNGANTPADLRRLLPDIARSWRRRKVAEVEVQTCIGVLAASTRSRQPFSLIDYGHNKIYIELDAQSHRAGGVGSIFNEDELNSLFYENLFTLWRSYYNGESTDGEEFLRSLPKAAITVSESFTKAAPIFTKGQQRLEDLKQGMAARKLEKATPLSVASTAAATVADTSMANSDGTKMSLLDRIRHKAMLKSQAPAGLTPAQLERRAALQRAAEVAALVGMLSRATAGGAGRMSFTMGAMLEKLKDTFRMGISREEGAACVRLLGKEIAPEWIRVIVVSGRENVVIDTNRSLGKGDIEKRVQQLL
ncbi:DNA replication factor Cdt1 C-terminal domain-containing protein [Microdochium nivale]|nr:DNA replication factor Cdt1 C-terminal domain-containing protein [Microdochium nivale]